MTNGEKYGEGAKAIFLQRAWKAYCSFWCDKITFAEWTRKTKESIISRRFNTWKDREATD